MYRRLICKNNFRFLFKLIVQEKRYIFLTINKNVNLNDNNVGDSLGESAKEGTKYTLYENSEIKLFYHKSLKFQVGRILL